jgi:UDP-glucose 4-epimerase
MRVLVTGGAGYIGSHTVDLLVHEGHDITVLDSLETGHREAVHPAAAFLHGDCGDAQLLDRVFSQTRFDAVMHFAAYIEAGDSMVHPGRFFVNNTARSLILLDRMTAHGVGKFIFSSTAATYGDPAYVPIDEDHPKAPTNAYGYAKLLVEGSLDWMNRLVGLRCASLRYFNVAGCGSELGEDHAPESHLIPLVLEVAQGKRPAITIFGTDYPTSDGTAIRDYVHVLDLASAHVMAMHALGEHSRLIYNLGNGMGYSVREVIETVRRVTGHAIPATEAPRRAGDPAVLVASSEKIQRELGWTPLHRDLETIIRSAWLWKQRYPQGYATPGQRPRWRDRTS